MKPYYLIISCILLCTSLNAQTAIAPPGNGSYGTPYLISTVEHLYWMSQTPSAWSNRSQYAVFRQVADIDASGTASWNGGEGFTPIGSYETTPTFLDQSFFGVYQGQGYAITGLTINRTAASSPVSCIGLFGSIGGGSVSNLQIKNAQIAINNYAVDYVNAGLFCGRVSSISLELVTVTGSITTYNTPDNIFIGGLAGLTSDASILRCSARGTFISDEGSAGGLFGTGGGARVIAACYATGTVSGAKYAGGLAASFMNYGSGTLRDCYANCAVYGGLDGAGGLMGRVQDALITRTYAAGSVGGSDYNTAGALIGTGTYNNVSYSYYDAVNAGTSRSLGGLGKSPAELRNVNMFINDTYDFVCEVNRGLDDFWVIRSDTNNGYPYLRWAGSPYSDNCRIWYGSTSSVASEPSNWSFNTPPSSHECVMMHHTASRDLVADADLSLDAIYFANGNVKYVLGAYNLPVRYTLGFHKNGYVKTNGTGRVIMSLPGGTTGYEGQIGIGNSTLNDVLVTNNTGVDDMFDLRVLDEVYEDGYSGPIKGVLRVKRTWLVGKQNANSSGGVTMQFRFQDGAIAGGPVGTDKPKIYHYSGGQWELATGMFNSFSEYPASMGGGGYASIFGYTGSFSPFSIILPSKILPLTWDRFTVSRAAKNALLKWSTASEQHTSRFIVLHSTNGNNWKEIGTIPASGNSSTVLNYQYTHTTPVTGKNYYRLRQEDTDGQYSFSKIVVLEQAASSKEEVKLKNNPVTGGVLYLELSQPAELGLFNAKGDLMLRKYFPAGNNPWSVSGLPAGVYYVRTERQAVRVLIQ